MAHSPQPIHGNTTRLSPTDTSVTLSPTATTSPAISWPRLNGSSRPPVRSALRPSPRSKCPSQMCRSLWQTPQAVTRISTSSPVGSGVGTSIFSSGLPNSVIAQQRMAFLPHVPVFPWC